MSYGDDIPLTISGGEQPPAGRFPAICTDVQYLGPELQRDGKWVKKMFLWFELGGDLRQADGQPFFVRRKFSTILSEHKNATLLPFLNAWRGRVMSGAERKAFRIISVVNASCILTLAKTVPDASGTTWTNIVGIEPSLVPVSPSGLYVRRQLKARTGDPQPQQGFSQQPYPTQPIPSPVQQPMQQPVQPTQQPMQPVQQPVQPTQQPQMPANGAAAPAPATPFNAANLPF
jgi:hypothetical protein